MHPIKKWTSNEYVDKNGAKATAAAVMTLTIALNVLLIVLLGPDVRDGGGVVFYPPHVWLALNLN